MRLTERILLSACTRSYRVSMHANFTVSLQCGPREVRVPIIRGCGRNLLKYTDARIQRVASGLHESGRRGRFVDVGANQGVMILNMLALGLNLPYLGFEPDLTAAYYVQELIRVNRLQDHHILPIALGSGNSMATFHRVWPGDGSNTLGLDLRPAQMYPESTLVPVSTADDQLGTANEPIFLVKIDTEGWEYNVLSGMQRTLRDKRPPVYFEVMGYRHFVDGTYPRDYFGGELSKDELERLIRNRRDNMGRLDQFWREHGYAVSLCREDGTQEVVRSLDPGPESKDNRGEMNFLAVG